MQTKPSTTPALSPTERTLTAAWLVILIGLVLVGNTHNHVPVGLWLLVGVIGGTLLSEFRRRSR
jgi:hypothetical protein